MNHGFFYGYEFTDGFGFSFVVIYTPEDKTLQVGVLVGCLAFAVGYTF